MCHQSVGLIARHLEAAGFPTVGLTSARTITAAANPPRSVLVDAPLGHTAGSAGDVAAQREILESALTAAVGTTVPGTIVDLPMRWHDDRWRSDPLGWSRRREDESGPDGFQERSGDTRTPRTEDRRYQSDDDRRAAEQVGWDVQCESCIGLDPQLTSD